MKTYKCPACKKPLTKTEYERALGILGEREKHLEQQKVELQKRLRDAKAKEKKARAEGISFERSRTQRLLAGKDKQINSLRERIDQLKKGSTPQTEGLEFENILVKRLKKEFPGDLIEHKGKGGDVLHTVIFENKKAGVIIYECKRTPRISASHINQAYQAKQDRKADFAVLDTTGMKRGFSGLSLIKGVLVVSPLGVIPLASLLRGHLIEMLRAKISKEKRNEIAQQLMKHIASPQFKNPIEEVVELSKELQEMIQEEANDHYRVWKKRWHHYQTISWDSSKIRNNINLVLHGKEPIEDSRGKLSPLELPAPPSK